MSKLKIGIKCHSERLVKNLSTCLSNLHMQEILGRGLLRMTILLSLLLTTYCLLLTPVFAQDSTPSSTSKVGFDSFEVSQTLPSSISPTSPLYTDLLVNNLFHTFSCLAVGQSVIGQPCLTYQLTKNAQGALQGIPVLAQTNLSGGAMGAVTSLIGAMYQNPPVRTADYLASVGQGLGIVKTANAQVVGSGAQVLSPILNLWQVSRNISYVIMIVIFVIIGIMVMIRNRINPQTVITAQAALPGLVIGLILITFSYFLAGLISDMAFVGTNVVGYYFAAAQGKTDDPERTNLIQHISDKNVLNIFGPLTGIVDRDTISGSLDAVETQLPTGVRFYLRIIVGFLVAQFFAPLAGGLSGIGMAAGGPWGLVVGPLTNILSGLAGFTAPTFTLGFMLVVIASLALIYAMIRLLLRLVTSFLTIIFLTISAPFQLLVAALPGRQGIATSWILNMLANTLVFPAVLVIFYFVVFLLGPSAIPPNYPLKVSNVDGLKNADFPATALAQGEGFQIVGPNNFPLFGGMNLNFIKILLAFGALMALPGIPDVVVRAIGRMGQAGQILGQEISGGVRAGQGYSNRFQGAVSETTSNLKRGIMGEQQYQYKEGVGWIPFYGKPGLQHIRQMGPQPRFFPPGSGPSPTGGAGR